MTTLTGLVRGPSDLPHVKVGVIEQSQPQFVLRTKFGVTALSYPDFRQGLEALDRGEISAFVAAAPVLRYEIANNFPATLVVVGEPFLRADYVFALPLSSDIRKSVNRSILTYIETDEWRNLLNQYFGGGR